MILKAVGKILKYVLTFFKVGKKLGKFGLARLTVFFGSSIRRWSMITLFVLLPHKEELVTLITSLNPVPLFYSLGNALATADQQILTEVAFIVSNQAAGFDYAVALFGIFTALATILWYFRAFRLGMEFIGGSDQPRLLTWGLSLTFYTLVVLLVQNQLPFQGVVALFQNWSEVVQSGRLYGLVNATNTTVDGNVSLGIDTVRNISGQ